MHKFWRYSESIALVMVAIMGFMMLERCHGQDTSCINQLLPCLNYLNGTKDVPSTCCDPLESVIKSDPECLCNMISNQGSKQAEQAGINVNEAQQLPARCGLRVNPLSCLSGGSGNTVDNSSSVHLLPSSFVVIAATASLSFCLQAFWFQIQSLY